MPPVHYRVLIIVEVHINIPEYIIQLPHTGASVISPLVSASFKISPVVMSSNPYSSTYALTSRKLLLATAPPLTFANAIAEASPFPMIRSGVFFLLITSGRSISSPVFAQSAPYSLTISFVQGFFYYNYCLISLMGSYIYSPTSPSYQ